MSTFPFEFTVVPKSAEHLKAVYWDGENGDDVNEWIEYHERGYDYDNFYWVREGVLYLGQSPLPVDTFLVLNEDIQHYVQEDFYKYFDEM